MRRRCLIIAVFLLLGAILNVLVAGYAGWRFESDKKTLRLVETDAIPRRRLAALDAAPNDTPVVWTARAAAADCISADWSEVRSHVAKDADGYTVQWTSREPKYRFLKGVASLLPGGGSESVYILRSGWPMRSLAVREYRRQHDGATLGWDRLGGLDLTGGSMMFSVNGIFQSEPSQEITFIDVGIELRPRKQWSVPVRLEWMGFLINTLLYAVILWIVIVGPRALRRHVRRRRGRCPKCAYPAGASAVCTECGSKLTRDRRSPSCRGAQIR